VYALAVLVAVSLWFLAIRAPLWLDETESYWNIAGGLRQIWGKSLQFNSFPAYFYILWLTHAVFGGKAVVLRIPSILAMLGAVYLLYRAARELFDRDVAIIVAVVFCLHPIVIFESIDIRPYAFAALAISASILTLVRLRHNDSNWLAALFGLSTAFILYFHFLFIVILPALVICFLTVKIVDRKMLWRQGSIALAAFALGFLPVIQELQWEFKSRGTHVFDGAPKLSALGLTLAPGWLPCIVAIAIFVAWATRKLDLRNGVEGWSILFCASLALIPILILYGVSAETSIHVFVFRYRLVAIPGIALCWGLIVSRIDSSTLRSLLCVALVASVACWYFTSPLSRLHGYTWKYALEFVEKNASADNAPVLVCSDFREADSVPMPVGEAVKDSGLFAPLTYYKLSVPVVGLPRALNEEAMGIVSNFLQERRLRKQRFLALGFMPSYKTLEFIESSASGTYSVRNLGVFDGIAVEEFTPRRAGEVELEKAR
jgi:4-amino-4-deoxy-L-arabinose transferase-like glycosyltransferase